MKKYIYVFCFVVLGIILQQIVHTVVELWFIRMLVTDFDKYGLGLTWDDWFMIHHVGGMILFLAGVISGYLCGRYFWPKLYDETGNVRNPRKLFGKSIS